VKRPGPPAGPLGDLLGERGQLWLSSHKHGISVLMEGTRGMLACAWSETLARGVDLPHHRLTSHPPPSLSHLCKACPSQPYCDGWTGNIASLYILMVSRRLGESRYMYSGLMLLELHAT
jgi:hypothetical protein